MESLKDYVRQTVKLEAIVKTAWNLSLHTCVSFQVLSKDSKEFKRLVEYVKNTHVATHMQYELEVMEVFKVDRHGEKERYEPFSKLHNRQLLWHGSRTTNFCGILSQVC